MRLLKVEFMNFRSISEGELDIEEDITCLVGVNESGKSNLLVALEKADKKNSFSSDDYSRHLDDYCENSKLPELKLWFSPRQSERKIIQDLLGHERIDTLLLVKSKNEYRLDFPEINYEKSTIKIFKNIETPNSTTPNIAVTNVIKQNITPQTTDLPPSIEESDKTIDEPAVRKNIIDELLKYLPNIIRFDSVDFEEYYLPGNGEVQISAFITDPDKQKPVKNLLNLGGISDFQQLTAENDSKRINRDKLLNVATQKINKEILRQVWPIESVELDLAGDGDILKIRIKEKGKTSPFKPNERSRGLQWALAFNIYFLSERKNAIKNTVVLIDEPGIFLHINAQEKLLKETFPKIVEEGNQIIYTSHLPYLIDSSYPERIRILEKEDEDTKIGNKAWSTSEFGKIPEPVRTALGLRWSEILRLTEKNVIVEGPSDQIILRRLFELFGEKQDISFLPAYGYEKFPSVLANIKIEARKAFAILDGDVDLDEIRRVCKIVSIEPDTIDNLPSIIDNKKIITIEDLIPENVFRSAVFYVYSPICSRRRNCKLEEAEIPVIHPRVNNLKDFFKKKFNSNSHDLLKMDISRAVVTIMKDIKVENDGKWDLPRKLVQEINKKFPLPEVKVTN